MFDASERVTEEFAEVAKQEQKRHVAVPVPDCFLVQSLAGQIPAEPRQCHTNGQNQDISRRQQEQKLSTTPKAQSPPRRDQQWDETR
jgi:hypothetical protein